MRPLQNRFSAVLLKVAMLAMFAAVLVADAGSGCRLAAVLECAGLVP